MSPAHGPSGGGLAPEGEALQQAIRWVSLKRQETPGASLGALAQEASRHFDLSPREEQTLLSLLLQGAPGA